MRKTALLTMLLLLASGIGLAEEAPANLPWGFSWHTTLAECTQLLQTQSPGAAYRIKPYGDTECIVTCSDKKASVSFEAIFSGAGGLDRNVRAYTPEALAGKTLQLESIGTVSLLAERPENRSGEMINAFYQTYREYAAAFGGADAALSYISANRSIDDVRYYHLPDGSGGTNLDRVKNDCMEQISTLRSYGIFLRNEHAQYRLNVYHIEGPSSGSKDVVGAVCILFTRESQPPTTTEAVPFP